MRRLGHVPALDGVRGVAILLVLGYHLGWLPGGLVGVDIFFALSGFLITTLLLEERHRTGRVGLRDFYARRARRLLPGLCVVLVAVAAAEVTTGQWRLLVYPASVLFYVGNLVRLSGHTFPHGLGQMWSLGQEEQFYLVWPALLIWALHRRNPATIARFLLGATAFVVVWRTVCWFVFGAGAHTFLSPDTRSDALLLGCAFAAARAAGYRPRLHGLGLAALAGVLAAGVMLGSNAALIAGLPLVALASVAMLADALKPNSAVARVLSMRPLRRLGMVSYSVYLWHVAVFDAFGSGPVSLVIAIGVGAASYHWIERPFRRPRTATATRVPVPQTAAR